MQTCFSTLFRRIRDISYRRERIITPDEDFLDLDWSEVGSSRLLIISHGLEGSSNGIYVRGMVRTFNNNGWDALAWNLRGCGGEPNDKLYDYHSGKSEDLECVIDHVLTRNYDTLVLSGFSVGGNITLKYLAERSSHLSDKIKAAVTFSVPCDLAEAAYELEKKENWIYMNRFITLLRHKMRLKHKLFPGKIDISDLSSIKTFSVFDDRFTAPLNGFKNASDYWSKASSLPLLARIQTPTLLVNALDDTFLGSKCYPYDVAERNSFLYLETPLNGGHVGFIDRKYKGTLWFERRAMEFVNEFL